MGAQLPQKASLHLIRRDGRGPAATGAAGGTADSRRGRSLPPEDMARIMDMRTRAQRDTALSLGAAPLSRQDIRHASGEGAAAKVPGGTPENTPSAAAAAAMDNPFAFNA